jgi:tRNA pseudouridine synthase 10
LVKDIVNNIILQDKSIKTIKRTHFICNYCYIRNFKDAKRNTIKYNTVIKIVEAENKECEICKNMFEKTIRNIYCDIIASNYFASIGPNTSIDIGSSLPFIFFENEDYLRSLFKIKGLPNIKNNFNALIRELITNKTGCMLNHINPDIKIEIVLDANLKFEIKYKTKEIFLLGRYNKYKRSFSQRLKKNHSIDSNKRDFRDLSDTKYNDCTVESTILEYLFSEFRPSCTKISWLGSEDENSLVLGSGRPFIVKVSNPSQRNFKKKVEMKDIITLNFEEVKSNDINTYTKYIIKTKILVKILEDKVEKEEIEKATSNLKGDISFYNKNKKIKKNIYTSCCNFIDNKNFELILTLDNGIPIKQLIGGDEFIEPCVSRLITRKCDCVFFDIMDIIDIKLNRK